MTARRWSNRETKQSKQDCDSIISLKFTDVIFVVLLCRIVKCTRWAELTESMLFMAELSEALKSPSEFRLLNGADPIIVGMGDDRGESLKFLKVHTLVCITALVNQITLFSHTVTLNRTRSHKNLNLVYNVASNVIAVFIEYQEVMEDSPAGPTPLCTQINAVVESILSIADVLKANGQKATVMIATDGESSDGNVADALRPLTNVRFFCHVYCLFFSFVYCWRVGISLLRN